MALSLHPHLWVREVQVAMREASSNFAHSLAEVPAGTVANRTKTHQQWERGLWETESRSRRRWNRGCRNGDHPPGEEVPAQGRRLVKVPGHRSPSSCQRLHQRVTSKREWGISFGLSGTHWGREQKYPTFMLPREPMSPARPQQSGLQMAGPLGHLHICPRLCLWGLFPQVS